MTASTQYIFCPFCGSTKWNKIPRALLSNFKDKINKVTCNSCKKFTYADRIVEIAHPILIGITGLERFYVQATLKDYEIFVQYVDNYTEFTSHPDGKILLRVDSAVTFNWYKNEDLVEKIKKYLLFS